MVNTKALPTPPLILWEADMAKWSGCSRGRDELASLSLSMWAGLEGIGMQFSYCTELTYLLY